MGDDEAGVGLGLLSTIVDSGWQRLCLRADQTPSRPRLTGPIIESVIGGTGLVVAAGKDQVVRKVTGYFRFRTGIGRQSKNETDIISFAPSHQIVSTESGIATDDEASPTPSMANAKAFYNRGDRMNAVATGVSIAGLQLAPHHVSGISENV